MSIVSTSRTVLLPLFLFGLALVVLLFLAPRLNPLPPRQQTFLIDAGDVSRTFVASATRITGRAPLTIRPHHVTYSSSNGPVEIVLTAFDLSAGGDEVRRMMEITEQFRAGVMPDRLVAESQGESGTIPLHWWPYGTVRYVAFIKAVNRSEVTLTVHYAP